VSTHKPSTRAHHTLCHPHPTALQLKTKIARALAAREQKQRKRNLAKYIPNCCDALWQVLAKMAAEQPGGPKRRRLEERHGVLGKVRVWGPGGGSAYVCRGEASGGARAGGNVSSYQAGCCLSAPPVVATQQLPCAVLHISGQDALVAS
jgi:hypothetical protein